MQGRLWKFVLAAFVLAGCLRTSFVFAIPLSNAGQVNSTGSVATTVHSPVTPFTLEPITVTNSGDAGPGTLRQAIADSVSGDRIVIAGTVGTITLTNGELLITNDLTITAPDTSVAIDAGGNSRVLEIAASNTVTLDSLIITNGLVSDFGGGILVDHNANLILTNCTVAGNSADSFGGGIYATNGSTVTINNSILSGNSTGAGGGGIANDGSILVATNSSFSANLAGAGGGILNQNNGIATINDSTLSDNIATHFGGGILNTNGSTATINNSTISGNACPSDQGGGIDNSGTLTINNCTIVGNHSGGGFVNTGGTAVCNNSTFSGNVALFDGGGFYTVSGNNTLNNCTLSGNSANRRAGGIYENTSVLVLTNTIVAGNTAAISDPNILGSISGANNLTNGDPVLAPLDNYGGPTQTMPPLAGSPAINTGIDSVTNLFTTDQRGYPRLASTHVDIGAVEVEPAIVINANDDGPGSLRAVAAIFPEIIAFTNALSGQTIHLTSGQLTLSNSVIIDASSLPGGILIDAGGNSRVLEITDDNTVALDSLTITNGNVSDLGGGILVDQDATLVLSNCTVAGNSAGLGGGIFNSNNSTVAVENSTFFANSASGNGGGIASYQAILTINNSTFTANSATSNNGGAIDNDTNSTLIVNNSSFSGNSANAGGGIYNNSGSNTLYNCTITGNSAGNGGGIFQDSSGTSDLTNTIVAGNTATNAPDTLGPFSGANNLIGGNPLLAPLGNYGGPTQTMPPLAGSPAINAGLDSDAPSFLTDQRGYPRKSGPHVDIGAVEVQLAPANNRPVLRLTRLQPGGGLGFSFSNIPNADFTILASTNLALPLNLWSILGPATQIAPGQYQFTDSTSTNSRGRFYQSVSP